MATFFKSRKATKNTKVSTHATTNSNPVVAAGGGAAAATTAHSTAGGTAVVAATSTGPDYESLYANPQQQAAYLEKRRQGGFNDWQRSKAHEKRGGKTFLDMMQEEFDGIASECPDGDINKLTLEQVNRAAVIFAQEGELEHLKWCVALGADLAFANSKAMSVLTAAAYRGQNTIVNYLLDELGLNPNKRGEYIAIASAGANGHVGTIKLLVNKGAYLLGRDAKDNTVVHRLLLSNHVQATLDLISHYTQKQNPAANECFDFKVVSHNHDNVLGAAFYALGRLHAKFYKDNPDGAIDELRILLMPAISLCVTLQALSQLPYGAASENNQRRSKPAVHAYATINDIDVAKSYIGDLYDLAPEFINAIISDSQNDTTNRMYNAFSSVAQAVEVARRQRAIMAPS